ncbi:hypothetical protein C5167_026559 [Papaver somniferum]|nr:hypothetical protein C5167_026559 [Papaver somniferum]
MMDLLRILMIHGGAVKSGYDGVVEEERENENFNSVIKAKRGEEKGGIIDLEDSDTGWKEERKKKNCASGKWVSKDVQRKISVEISKKNKRKEEDFLSCHQCVGLKYKGAISEKQRSEKNWILGVLKRNIFGVYGGIPSVVVFGVGNGDGGRRDLMEMVVVVIHYITLEINPNGIINKQDLRAFLKWDVVHLDFPSWKNLKLPLQLMSWSLYDPTIVRHWFVESWRSTPEKCNVY